MNRLENKKVVLAVTGGIAAFKIPELASRLIREGAQVRVAMSRSATRFITPLTFEMVTRNTVSRDLSRTAVETGADHENLAYWAEVVVIAPATPNIIAKMASGLADDYVSSFLLCVEAPVVVCPSMSEAMFGHPTVRKNLARIEEMGHRIVEPGPVDQACSWEDRGGLPDVNVILEEVRYSLSWKDLAGLQLVGAVG